MAGPAAKLKTRSWDSDRPGERSWMCVAVAAHLTDMGLAGFRGVVVVRRVEVMGMLAKVVLEFLRKLVFGFWRRSE